MKKKHIELKLVCPACGNTKGPKNLTKLFAQTDLDLSCGGGKKSCSLEKQVLGLVWACDACLSNGTALQAVTKNHKTGRCGCESFRLAYFDQERTCERCKEQFVFAKEEQKYWYEELKFYPASIANECCSCRKAMRKENSGPTRLSRLLPRFENGDVTVLETIVEIYVEMDKVEGAKKILALAAKRYTKEPNVLARIMALRAELPVGVLSQVGRDARQ